MQNQSVDHTLHEHGQQYGNFSNQAKIAQELKKVIHSEYGYTRLSSDKREALDIILHKISRIVNGNPDHIDTWHDIAGYATLVERILTSEQSQLTSTDSTGTIHGQ